MCIRDRDYFVNFISEPLEPILWGFAFLILCVLIILKGVAEGIEKISKILMPALFILLIGTALRLSLIHIWIQI